MSLWLLCAPSSKHKNANIGWNHSASMLSLSLSRYALWFLLRECTYPSSESHLQMFSICPLLQHLLCCSDMLHYPTSWVKNSPPPQALQRLLPSEPVLKHLYCRKAETATWSNEVSSVELSTENFPVCLILFLLNSSTSCIVLRICHSPPWWSFPGLTILLYLLSPYNTAVPWLPYLGCPVSAKPFQEGLQRAPW